MLLEEPIFPVQIYALSGISTIYFKNLINDKDHQIMETIK